MKQSVFGRNQTFWNSDRSGCVTIRSILGLNSLSIPQMPRYSAQYLAKLLAQRDYGALVELQGIALGWDGVDANLPSYGWPQPIFVVFEMLTWLAQADRSGVWTYYEATPVARLECVLVTLEVLQAVELRQQFAYGKAYWHDAEAIGELDNWICRNEQTLIEWAFVVLADYSTELALVCS